MRLKKDERRAQILQIAIRLFAEKGYHETKTKDIALACEITEPVIYKHFGSKEELFLEVIDSIAGETFQELRFDNFTDTEQVITSFVKNKVENVEVNFALFKRLLTEILENEKIRNYYFNKYLPRLAYPIIGYLENLKIQGHIDKDLSSKVISLSLAGILIMVSMAKYLEGKSAFSELTSQDLAGQMLHIYLHGLLKT